MRALDGSNTANETQVLLLMFAKAILRQLDSMMNGADARHGLLVALEFTDGNVIHIRIASIEITNGIMGTMKRVDCRNPDESGAGQPLSCMQMDQVAALRCILRRPGCVVHVLEQSVMFSSNRPLGTLVYPTTLRINR